MKPANVRKAPRTLGRRSGTRSAPRAVVEQRLAPLCAACRQRGEAGLAEAAARHARRPGGTPRRRRVGDQPQVGEQVLHLAPLVEADRADEPIGDPRAAERLFQRPRLRVGAVEHRHVGVAADSPAGAAALQLAHHPLRLVALVGRGEQGHLLPAPPTGHQRLPHPARVLGDDARWRRRARPGWSGSSPPAGPAWRPAKSSLEVQHVADVGAAPAVDRLVVVAHGADVAVRAQQPDQLVLRPVGVLELIHQDEARTARCHARSRSGCSRKSVSGCSSRSSKSIAFAALQRRAHGADTRRRRPWRGGRRASPTRRAPPATCIRFFAAEMSDCTARGGNSLGGMAALVHQALDQRSAGRPRRRW